MMTKIAPKVWKYTCSDLSNIYFLDLDKKIIIDCGNRADKQEIETFLSKAVDFNKVDIVIFTHLHYDHIGNFDLFPNAEFYASSEEIEDFQKNKFNSLLNEDMVEKFNVELKALPEKLEGLEIVKASGHTRGSICVWYPEEKILFSGDTLFNEKQLGRTDLPTSVPDELNNSLMVLLKYNFRILAPGHDY